MIKFWFKKKYTWLENENKWNIWIKKYLNFILGSNLNFRAIKEKYSLNWILIEKYIQFLW